MKRIEGQFLLSTSIPKAICWSPQPPSWWKSGTKPSFRLTFRPCTSAKVNAVWKKPPIYFARQNCFFNSKSSCSNQMVMNFAGRNNRFLGVRTAYHRLFWLLKLAHICKRLVNFYPKIQEKKQRSSTGRSSKLSLSDHFLFVCDIDI